MKRPQRTLTPGELMVLDRLIGRALLDSAFCARLLKKDDSVYLAEPELSLTTWNWLKSLPSPSLQQLCQAILNEQATSLTRHEFRWNDDSHLSRQ